MTEENRIEQTPIVKTVSPTGAPVLPQVAVRIAAAIVAVAGVVVTLPAGGIPLPPIVTAIAGAIVALGASFGIVSQGARKA